MRGAIAWMARNGVAANLLMTVVLATGIISFFSLVQEVFPEFSLGIVQVRVEYPGGSPGEIETAIVQRIEDRIEGIEGVRTITSVAAENVGVVTAELERGASASRVRDEITAAVGRITGFPAEAEEPEVQELTSRRRVLQVAVYGDVPERTLKELAYRVRDDLTADPRVSYAEVTGVRDYEISIEVPRDVLRAYDLELAQIAAAVRRGSLDLPGGSVETPREEVGIRTLGQSYTRAEYERIIVLGTPDGARVPLGRMATVVDGFRDVGLITRFNGRPAALVDVFRTADERVFGVVEAVEEYLAGSLRPSLPPGIGVAIWQNEAELLRSRLDLLFRNGAIGLLLVVITLALFLDLRLAFWTSVGILVSFIGTLAVMNVLGISINQISLFGFILAIGIVVDDAIVVGENTFSEREAGRPPLDAAIRGTHRVATPVTFAVLTTVAAFTPLLFVPGTSGKIAQNIPVVVISVLLLSLVESLFILPHHLSTMRERGSRRPNRLVRRVEGVQARLDRALKRFIEGPLRRAVRFSTRYYGVVIAASLSALLLTAGVVMGGYVRFSFFPEVEGEVVAARLEMPAGRTAEQTRAVAEYLERKGWEAARELERERSPDAPPLVQNVFTMVGQQPSSRNGPAGSEILMLVQPNVAEVDFELPDPEVRGLSALRFEELWREKAGSLPGVKSLTFSSSLVQLGKPVQVELSAPDPQTLDRAVERVKAELSRFGGVTDIQSDRDRGRRQVELTLRPEARTLGVTLEDLARQVRAAFFGSEALRVQRGREEVRVLVRLPEAERNAIADLEAYRIRTPAGGAVPLREVAEVSLGYEPSRITRKEGRRIATVTAEVDPAVVAADAVNGVLREEVLPRLQRELPGVRSTFGGEQEEQAETLDFIARGLLIALFVIYALLAVPFRSYTQPLVIMSVIPFGLIGAVLGHMIMGINLTVISLFGVVGLSGVVVNDSLVLMDFVNEGRREGKPMAAAITEAAESRFRPIVLTSITTFLGVFPLIVEKSIQAQFLIPLAVSIGFGILFATVLVMLLVPALAMLHHDAVALFRRKVLGRRAESGG